MKNVLYHSPHFGLGVESKKDIPVGPAYYYDCYPGDGVKNSDGHYYYIYDVLFALPDPNDQYKTRIYPTLLFTKSKLPNLGYRTFSRVKGQYRLNITKSDIENTLTEYYTLKPYPVAGTSYENIKIKLTGCVSISFAAEDVDVVNTYRYFTQYGRLGELFDFDSDRCLAPGTEDDNSLHDHTHDDPYYSCYFSLKAFKDDIQMGVISNTDRGSGWKYTRPYRSDTKLINSITP